MLRMLGACFDRRVLVALALGLGAVWLLAPQWILAALPLALVALCPLSMVVMAFAMRGMAQPSATGDPRARVAALEQEQERLAREIAQARREVTQSAPVSPPTP